MGEIMENLTLTAALAKALGGGGGGGSGGVSDVLLNGQSIVNAQGKAEIPLASTDNFGAVKVGNGLFIFGEKLLVNEASIANIKSGDVYYRPISPYYQHWSVFYGLAKIAGYDEKNSTLPVGTYTEEAKSAISQMLSAPEIISGSTPSITALPGIRYVCGEVSTLDIALPASGIVDVVFESGATPTVLSGLDNVRWTGDFDPDNLEANTTYEINIADGLGVAASWT